MLDVRLQKRPLRLQRADQPRYHLNFLSSDSSMATDIASACGSRDVLTILSPCCLAPSGSSLAGRWEGYLFPVIAIATILSLYTEPLNVKSGKIRGKTRENTSKTKTARRAGSIDHGAFDGYDDDIRRFL